jgi:cytosine/adenosine deaminase-related metal-dependent hydrolase
MRKIAAPYIFPISSLPVKNGIIVAENDGTIIDIIDNGGKLVEQSGVEYYNGVIVPGFVNAHCHIELSYLAGKINNIQGLTNFISQFIQLRNNIPDKLNDIINRADKQMQAEGIVAVGDISNSNISFDIKSKSKISYYTFCEIFNTDNTLAQAVFSNGQKLLNELINLKLKGSLTPHAPYTMSKQLLNLIKQHQGQHESIYSIHNQESEFENEMFSFKTGKLFEFLKNAGMSFESFEANHKNSLPVIAQYFPNKNNILLIHNIYTSSTDIKALRPLNKNVFWVLCPKSNILIEQRLPNIELLINSGYPIALGTDSLASNNTLSILEEIKVIKSECPAINFETIVRWGTLNGAKALNCDNVLGSFEKGKNPGINLITKFDFENMSPTTQSAVNVLL